MLDIYLPLVKMNLLNALESSKLRRSLQRWKTGETLELGLAIQFFDISYLFGIKFAKKSDVIETIDTTILYIYYILYIKYMYPFP